MRTKSIDEMIIDIGYFSNDIIYGNSEKVSELDHEDICIPKYVRDNSDPEYTKCFRDGVNTMAYIAKKVIKGEWE